MSSFESMSGTLSEPNWALQSTPMHERNYPCSNIVWSYFGKEHNLSVVGEAPFQRQLYLCMLVQYQNQNQYQYQCRAVPCSAVQYSTVQYSAVQYSTVLDTVQYSTVQ